MAVRTKEPLDDPAQPGGVPVLASLTRVLVAAVVIVSADAMVVRLNPVRASMLQAARNGLWLDGQASVSSSVCLNARRSSLEGMQVSVVTHQATPSHG